ncbi:MAG: hypothetical protein ACE5D1_09515, partial [Fidelibacterota bacterium]
SWSDGAFFPFAGFSHRSIISQSLLTLRRQLQNQGIIPQDLPILRVNRKTQPGKVGDLAGSGFGAGGRAFVILAPG